jgi:iron only hydrogenase large subunit-like protein
VGKIIANDDGSFAEVHSDGLPQPLPETKISLADCLACSGCITTAETVLIEAQGTKEFLRHLKTGETVVVSISPQSRASIAAHFGLSIEETFAKLCSLFQDMGVTHVFDTSYGDEISLLETAFEFVQRKKQDKEGTLPMICSSCPGWICYAEKTQPDLIPLISTTKSPQQVSTSTVNRQFY